jgi:ABC-type phosphate transport system auxiliary subunit
MYDFLPRDVRDLAVTALAAMWQERTDPARSRRAPSAHPASEYLLSGRLRARQDDGVLVGTLSGPPGKKTAYYRHRRSKRGRLKGSIYNNLIRAKALHDALAALLAKVLLDAPDLRDRLTRHMHEQREEVLQDRPDVAQLEAERDELRQQISATMQCLSGPALEDAKAELRRLGDRRNALEARLAALRTENK